MFLPDVVAHHMLDAEYVNGGTKWCGLSTTVPRLQAGAYVDITEPAAASYARVEVLASEWPAASERAVQTEVVFPDPVEDYGVVVAWVLFDSPVGGVCRAAGEPEEGGDLQAGASDVTVTARIEFPASL